jgi:hypothetical protein
MSEVESGNLVDLSWRESFWFVLELKTSGAWSTGDV